MTRKTVAAITDRDMGRTITILRDNEPLIAGELIGTTWLSGRVALDLYCAGLRVYLYPMDSSTPCELTESKES